MTDEPNLWQIGDVTLMRVPYFDTPLPAESIGLGDLDTSEDWMQPWLTDGQPTIGQAFWVVKSDGTTIVVDPCGAADEFLRKGPDAITHQDAALSMLEGAGVARVDVDVLVLTHLDGIGMSAVVDEAGAWHPAFDGATFVVSDIELDAIHAHDGIPGRSAFLELERNGHVTAVEVPHELAPGVHMVSTPGHGPGHCTIEIESRDERAILIGHLAVSPLHAAFGPCEALHIDPDEAWDRLENAIATSDGALLAGSLWPTPGAARVVDGVLVPDSGSPATAS